MGMTRFQLFLVKYIFSTTVQMKNHSRTEIYQVYIPKGISLEVQLDQAVQAAG